LELIMVSRRSTFSPSDSSQSLETNQAIPDPIASEFVAASNDSAPKLVDAATQEKPLPAGNDPSKGLTVRQAHELLGRLITHGQGSSLLGVPFDPGFVTMGSSPFMPITNFHPGIDWNHGRVTASTKNPLAAPSQDLNDRLRRMDKERGQTFLGLRRLLHILESESVLGAAEVLREVTQVVGDLVHAGSPIPYTPPARKSSAKMDASITPVIVPSAPAIFILPRAPTGGKKR
jgi:hypothetical protein